jgi:ATP-binding cassette subfamily B protein
LKNIVISFVAAQVVINGSMSLGMMLSISYVIGLANGPLEQLIDFFRQGQDASLSLARLREIHEKGREEDIKPQSRPTGEPSPPHHHDGIAIRNLSFQYGGPKSARVLDGISLDIPKGKITAIVGSSGSGKTTLMKLLLKFYTPTSGEIFVNSENLENLSASAWRKNCGTVMQNGYVFSDSIARNIALEGLPINDAEMKLVVDIANIEEHIMSLPLKYNTRLSSNGGSLSQGQKQRLLIARALYRDPEFLFFDEATSSLDANNERTVMNNLQKFFHGKTVIIIAHRLSTVRNADQILVLENGKLVESGDHESLIETQGHYFRLIKNQLELGQ